MSLAGARVLCGILSRQTSSPRGVMGVNARVALPGGPWFAPVLTLKTSAPLWAEPKRKKKVDPKREQMQRERLKKKLKKLERVPPELIPIEDFITPAKCLDETRVRSEPRLSLEESERRALLMKEWSRYKRTQHQAEVLSIDQAVEAQREALEELRVECEHLYRAALRPDSALFPFSHQGPCFTPAPPTPHRAPDGRYNDTTKVYTQ